MSGFFSYLFAFALSLCSCEQYTLTHAIPELVAVVINLIFLIPYGLSPLMILSIDMLTEVGRSPFSAQLTSL